MKLYCNISNDKGKMEGIGGDKWIEMELSIGNIRIGRVILDFQGGKDWDLSYEKWLEPSYLIDSSTKEKCGWCGENMYAKVQAHHHTEIVEGKEIDVTDYRKEEPQDKTITCIWCAKPATHKDWREIDEMTTSTIECDDCENLSTNYLLKREKQKAKQQQGEICDFNACKNKAVYYGVCQKHKKLEE